MRRTLLLAALLLPASLVDAQEKQAVPAGPPLSPFTAERVAIMPAQLWRADTVGWSKAVSWAATRLALDSAVQRVLEERGLGRKWAYPADVVRSARRNPTYASDPYSLGVGRWRTKVPELQEQLPTVLADNLRSLTALSDTRYALIPVELRTEGDAVVLRLILADTRARMILWAGDLISPAGATMVEGLATRIADLIIEP